MISGDPCPELQPELSEMIPTTSCFARTWGGALREAGTRAAELIERMPAEGQFQLFIAQECRAQEFWIGRDADGRPAEPWAWRVVSDD